MVLITCVRKLTDSRPKDVHQNAWYLLHVSVIAMRQLSDTYFWLLMRLKSLVYKMNEKYLSM